MTVVRSTGWFWRFYSMLYDTIWDAPITSELAQVISRYANQTGALVDLGCGTGLAVSAVHQPVIGVDTSPAMLARALASGRVTRTLVAPAEATGLTDAVAGTVLVANVLHLHPNPGAVLAEAARLCAAGGRVIISWPHDGLTPRRMLSHDIASGRGLTQSLLAHILRLLVGGVALGSSTRRYDSAHIEKAVAAWPGPPPVTNLLIGGCQRVLVLPVVVNSAQRAI